MITLDLMVCHYPNSHDARSNNDEEYQGIDIRIGPELVLRARQTHGLPGATAPVPSYGIVSYGLPQQPQALPVPAQPQLNIAAALNGAQGNSNLASIISSLDPSTLQKLLSNLQGQNAPSPTTNIPPAMNGYPIPQNQPNLASLFNAGALPPPPPQQQQQHHHPHQHQRQLSSSATPQQQQQYALQSYSQNNPDLSALFAGSQHLQQNQQVRNLMDQLSQQQQQQWSNGR